MAASERQNRYRVKRRLKGDKRISIWLTKEATEALSKTTKYLGLTQEHIIKNFILNLGKLLPDNSTPNQ